MANKAEKDGAAGSSCVNAATGTRCAWRWLLLILLIGVGCAVAGRLFSHRSISATEEQLIGEWTREETQENPRLLTVFRYSFYANGEGGFSETDYEYLGDESDDPRAEHINNGCWAACGGSGQYGRYSIHDRQLTLITEASAQYGASQVYAYDITELTDTALTLCAVDDGEHAVYTATYSDEKALTFTKEE